MRIGPDYLRSIVQDEIPESILLADWIPQADLLGIKTMAQNQPYQYIVISASGRISIFISHCGSFGSQEAVYNGVPIAALPLFEDQFYNAQRIVDKNLGLMLPSYKTASVDEVTNVLGELLRNKRSES